MPEARDSSEMSSRPLERAARRPRRCGISVHPSMFARSRTSRSSRLET